MSRCVHWIFFLAESRDPPRTPSTDWTRTTIQGPDRNLFIGAVLGQNHTKIIFRTMRKSIPLHRNARITNFFLKNIGLFWMQSTVDLLYPFLTVSAFVSVVVKPVMNAIVQV